jgi:putative ABC transport system ATP-binding protein
VYFHFTEDTLSHSCLSNTSKKVNAEKNAAQLSDLTFSWPASEVQILKINQLSIVESSRTLIQGPSGSGKTTLLSLLAGILLPTTGKIEVLGTDLNLLNSRKRDAFRADHIGFLFQQFNLISYLPLVENVLLPCRFSKLRFNNAGNSESNLRKEITRLFSLLGLKDLDLSERVTRNLSVGQQQRVAAARALVGSPKLVLADEPTSALDPENRLAFMDLILSECSKQNTTLIMVSHDTSLSEHFDQVIKLQELNQMLIY